MTVVIMIPVIVVIVIVIIVAIEISTMMNIETPNRVKKNTKPGFWIFGIILIWGFFFLLPEFLIKCKPDLFGGKERVPFSELNTAYVAASALFTALAFSVTFYTLKTQQKNLLEQRKDLITKTTLEVLTNTFDDIINAPEFLKSKDYIFSNHFSNHLKQLKKQLETPNIIIDDFLRLKTGITTSKRATKPRNTKINSQKASYRNIVFFCDKMEYIGVIVKNKFIDDAILDYYGKTIINSYEKLEPLIEEHRKRKGDIAYYIHFTYLYDAAKRREIEFIPECQKYICCRDKNK